MRVVKKKWLERRKEEEKERQRTFNVKDAGVDRNLKI
jgi:hypothetical protein